MSVVSVKARSFILALFIRDDGERFLLGDNGYEFKDSQLHFAANTIENDEVMKQGADGVMVAGQVRRASVQSFDGFVGDATMAKETIEQMRRDFFAFFIKGHHFRVVYIDCNRNAWQRKGGYLVDAPEVKELWQIHPEYHVGLNFEDVNYYSYDEDADGNEILANLVNVPVSTEIEGGLVWDEDGAVSEDASDIYYDTATATATPGKIVNITDATEAPLASFRLDGETSQNGTPTPDAPVAVQTVTGENVVKICGKNLLELVPTTFDANGVAVTVDSDGTITFNGTATGAYNQSNKIIVSSKPKVGVGETVTYSYHYVSGTVDSDASTGINLRSSLTTTDYQFQFNSSYIRIGSQDSSTTITAVETGSTRRAGYITYVQIFFPSGRVFNNLKTKLQLEKGSSATAYEPYQSQSYPISLGSIELCGIGDDGAGGYLYQDYIYKNLTDNKWYVRKEVGKIIEDGSQAWYRLSTAISGKYMLDTDIAGMLPVTSQTVAPPVFCSHFTPKSFNDLHDNGTIGISGRQTGRDGVYIFDNVHDTAASFQTWLQTNPMTIYYVLATPTDTEITNETLIEQLEAVLGGHTYAGTNNITTITPNEQGTLEISYYTKYQPMVVGGGYVWEAGGAGGATIVVNNSIDSVNPIWKIFGPTQNPQLENSTTGETIEYVGMIVEGQTLTIDMGEQTASLDGLNVISNVVGDSISLAPGANRLIYSVLGDAGASSIGWSEIVG